MFLLQNCQWFLGISTYGGHSVDLYDVPVFLSSLYESDLYHHCKWAHREEYHVKWITEIMHMVFILLWFVVVWVTSSLLMQTNNKPICQWSSLLVEDSYKDQLHIEHIMHLMQCHWSTNKLAQSTFWKIIHIKCTLINIRKKKDTITPKLYTWIIKHTFVTR